MHHFPDLLGRLLSTSLFYFKSSWEDIRAAAPMLTGEAALGPPPAARHADPDPGPAPAGFLVLHVEAEHWPQVDLEQLLAGEPQSWGPRPPRRAGPR